MGLAANMTCQGLRSAAVYFNNMRNPLVRHVLAVGRQRRSSEEGHEDSKEERRKEGEEEENGMVAGEIARGNY